MTILYLVWTAMLTFILNRKDECDWLEVTAYIQQQRLRDLSEEIDIELKRFYGTPRS